ncbi:hypothetical protein D3C81_1663380 [compost metagenome]
MKVVIQRNAHQVGYSRQNIYLTANIFMHTGRNAWRRDNQRDVNHVDVAVVTTINLMHQLKALLIQ